MRTKKGFTLIELLVVIAIIALLLAILMPALRRVKEAGKRIQCLSNVKTLSMSYVMYLDDHEGILPIGAGTEAWCNMVVPPYEHNPLAAPKELQIDAIVNGLLYPYVENVKVEPVRSS